MPDKSNEKEIDHTPGPWVQSHRECKDGMYNTEIYTPDGRTIATIAWYPKPPVTVLIDGLPLKSIGTYREANARLIAAAPCMLEALEETLVAWQNINAKLCYYSGNHPCTCTPCKVKAAIAKAKGGTHE